MREKRSQRWKIRIGRQEFAKSDNNFKIEAKIKKKTDRGKKILKKETKIEG